MTRLPPCALLLACFLAAGCSEDERSPVGAGQLPPPADTIQEVVLEPVLAESFLTGSSDRGIPPSDAAALLVAARDLPDPAGFESRILLRFDVALGDTAAGAVVVDSARIRLTISDTSPDTVAFRLHRVTAEWDEEEVSWEERLFEVPWQQPGGDFDPVPVAQGILAGDSASLGLPDSLAQRWLDQPETNEGVVLLLDTPAAYAQVVGTSGSIATESFPRLELFVTRNDSSRVSNPPATADASVSTYRGSVLPGVAIGNEPLLRSVLRFDVSTLPPDANINLVELQLVPRQVVNPVDSLRIELRRVVSPFLAGATVFTQDPGDTLATEVASADSVLFVTTSSLATLVRLWQADSTFNLGIGLQARRRSGNLGFAVYGGSDAAPADRPRLRIIFTPALEPDLGRGRP